MKSYRWHKAVFEMLRYTAAPIIRHAMKYSYEKPDGPHKPSLIVSNHNTDLDPVLVAMSFSRHIYFLASEHALRAGFASKLLKRMFNPIPINKVKPDIGAIKEIIVRIKAGASVCFFPEGDRSYNGVTAPVTVAAAKLAKKSGADLITFRLEGGYFTRPRWSKEKRKGGMTGVIVGRYAAADIKEMTDEQVTAIIDRDIYEDAYERIKLNPSLYKCNNPAENIEAVLYLCPECERIGTIKSKGAGFICSCGLAGVYTETGQLEGERLQYNTITEWDRWQAKKLEEIVAGSDSGQICGDREQQLYEVHSAVGQTLAGTGDMWISRDEFHCAGKTFSLDNINRFAIVGQMTLLFSLKSGEFYEVRSAVPRSALKYKEIYRILYPKE